MFFSALMNFSSDEFLKGVSTAHLPTYASPQFMMIVNRDKNLHYVPGTELGISLRIRKETL